MIHHQEQRPTRGSWPAVVINNAVEVVINNDTHRNYPLTPMEAAERVALISPDALYELIDCANALLDVIEGGDGR